jgi:hypothetical protein
MAVEYLAWLDTSERLTQIVNRLGPPATVERSVYFSVLGGACAYSHVPSAETQRWIARQFGFAARIGVSVRLDNLDPDRNNFAAGLALYRLAAASGSMIVTIDDDVWLSKLGEARWVTRRVAWDPRVAAIFAGWEVREAAGRSG